MTLRSIQLIATESNWRFFMLRKSDTKFADYQKKIFLRDQHICQFCGFQALEYLEVINIDHNYTNNKLSNLATACPYCAQCFFLEAVGKGDFGGGSLIYLPEISQNALNASCHILFTSILSGGPLAKQAKNIYRNLRLRGQYVEKELGEGMNMPNLYGQLIIDASTQESQTVHQSLQKKLRLLPNMNKYMKQVETWLLNGIQQLGE